MLYGDPEKENMGLRLDQVAEERRLVK